MTSKLFSNITLFVMISLFVVIVTGANLQNTDIGLVSSRSLDEYAFFGVLDRMLIAFDQNNWREFLDIVFLNYGFPYFFLQWLITFPFLRGNMYDAVLFIMREFSMIWVVGYVVLSYIWVQKRSNSNLVALFCAAVLLSQPGAWSEAMNIHPDHMMTFFVVCTLMYLDWQAELKSWKVLSIAGVIYAFALSAKFQAILYFLPIFIIIAWDIYAAPPLDSTKTIPQWKDISKYRELAKRISRLLSVTFVSYLFLNPYMLTSWGISGFVNLFFENMKSNATNHFSYVLPTIEDKLDMLSLFFYTPFLIIVLAIVAAINVAWLARGNQRRTGIALLVSSTLVFLYVLIAVNKTWHHYYLTVFVLLPIGLLLTIRTISGSLRTNILSAISLIVAGLMSFSAASNIPDIIDQRIKDDRKDLAHSKNLETALSDKISSESNIVISPRTPFRFHQFDIPYSNMHVIWGSLTRKYAARGDVLIVRKDDSYFDDEMLKGDNATAQQYQHARVFLDEIIAGNNFMFAPCAETPSEFIFCKKAPQTPSEIPLDTYSANITQQFLKTPTNQYDSKNILWSNLTYSTRLLLFFSFFTDINFSAISSQDLIPNLIVSNSEKAKIPQYDQSLQISINSEVFGRKHRIDSWFDADLTLLQKTHLKTGGDRYRQKAIRFAENSIFTIEKEPINENEKLQSPKEWTGLTENTSPIQTENKQQVFTDFSALFYALSASKLSNSGDQLALLTRVNNQIIQISAEVVEIVDISVDYLEESSANQREISENRKVLKIKLIFNEPGNLSDDMFVDWVQTVNVYMDPNTRLIHNIGVKVDYLGTIDFVLDRVNIRKIG